MILSDKDFRKEVKKHNIVEPFIEKNLQPCSLDLRLDKSLLIPRKDRSYNLNEEIKNTKVEANGYILKPGEFVLGSTKEWVNIPEHLTGSIEGKSSIGRMGLIVHLTAGWIDAGFKGNITLEILNNSGNEIILKEGALIAQLVLHQLSSSVEQKYDGKYQGSKGVVGNKSIK